MHSPMSSGTHNDCGVFPQCSLPYMSPKRAPEFGGRSLRCSGRTPVWRVRRSILDRLIRTAIITVRPLSSDETRALLFNDSFG